MKRDLMALAALMALFSTACQHVNPKTAAGVPPPPPTTVVAPPANVAPIVTTPVDPPADPPKPEARPVESAVPVTTTPAPAPTTTTPAPAPLRKPQTVSPPKADPPPPPVFVPPAPPGPRIEASLPQAQRDAYKRRAEGAISESRHNIEALKQARLDNEDRATLQQARTFLGDAEKMMKGGDVVRAATLAEKARLLTGEILKRLQG